MHKRHALSLWASTKACMRREVTLIYRHAFVYLFRLLQVGDTGHISPLVFSSVTHCYMRCCCVSGLFSPAQACCQGQR